MIKLSLVAIIVAMSLSGAANASAATDAFGKCLTQSSTGRDRIEFVRWFFVALSANPNVQSLAASTPTQHAEIEQRTMDVMQRLVFTDCHAEAVAAIKQDGTQALETAFETFGRSAATELMSDPAVEKELNSLSDHADRSKWAVLVEEAKK